MVPCLAVLRHQGVDMLVVMNNYIGATARLARSQGPANIDCVMPAASVGAAP